MNITLKTKIRYNGQEYSSPDQMPPEARAAYERALAGNTGSATLPNGVVATRTIFNGREVASPADLPANEKKFYDDLIQVMKDGGHVETSSQLVVGETGWLTLSQRQMVLVVAGLLAAVLAILAVRMLTA